MPLFAVVVLAIPRRPRIHFPGLPIHVVQRGHNRDACFFAKDDYLGYRYWLGEALKKTGCLLHGYVLMTTRASTHYNEVHPHRALKMLSPRMFRQKQSQLSNALYPE